MTRGRKLIEISPGPSPPEVVHAVIETPKGSKNKYEYSEDLDSIVLDRVLHSSVMYPLAYGFVPSTRYLDGDPLDIMVLMSEPVYPGCLVKARPLGMLRMLDSGQEDDKVLASVVGDPRVAEMNSYRDLPRQGWVSKDRAFSAITSSIQRYGKNASDP
jgi:inorganic pyrophosphatase